MLINTLDAKNQNEFTARISTKLWNEVFCAEFDDNYLPPQNKKLSDIDFKDLPEDKNVACVVLMMRFPDANLSELFECMTRVGVSYSEIFTNCVFLGRVDVLDHLQLVDPVQFAILIKEKIYDIFKRGIRYEQLAVLKKLKEICAELEFIRVVDENDEEFFYEMCVNFNINIAEWFKQQVGNEKIAEFIKHDEYDAFSVAALFQKLEGMKWLKTQVTKEQLTAAILARNGRAFKCAMEHDNIKIINWLREQISLDEYKEVVKHEYHTLLTIACDFNAVSVVEMLKIDINEKDFSEYIERTAKDIIEHACRFDNLEILVWIKNQIPLTEFLKIIRADNYHMFQQGAINTRILKFLKDHLSAQEWISLVASNDYQIFRKLINVNFRESFEWIKSEFPDEMVNMVRANDYESIVNLSRVHSKLVKGFYQALTDLLIPHVDEQLKVWRKQKADFEKNNPGAVFIIEDNVSILRILKDLIVINTPQSLEDIRFLVSIPSVKTSVFHSDSGKEVLIHAKKWKATNPAAFYFLNNLRKKHLDLSKLDPSISRKLFKIPVVSNVRSKITFPMPTHPNLLQNFLRENSEKYMAGVKNLAERLVVWARINQLPTSWIDRFLRKFSPKLSSHQHIFHTIYPLLSDGVYLLDKILNTIEGPNCPPNAKRIIADLIPYLTFCEPGIYTRLNTALWKLSGELDIELMADRKNIVDNIIAEIALDIMRERTDLIITEGMEVHYGNLTINYYHEDLCLPEVEDTYADESDLSNSNELHSLFLDKFPEKFYRAYRAVDIINNLANGFDLEKIGNAEYANQFWDRMKSYGDDPSFNVQHLFDQDALADDEFKATFNARELLRISIMMRLMDSGYFNNILQEIKLKDVTVYLYPGEFDLSYAIVKNTRIPLKEYILTLAKMENDVELSKLELQLLENVNTADKLAEYLRLMPVKMMLNHPEKITQLLESDLNTNHENLFLLAIQKDEKEEVEKMLAQKIDLKQVNFFRERVSPATIKNMLDDYKAKTPKNDRVSHSIAENLVNNVNANLAAGKLSNQDALAIFDVAKNHPLFATPHSFSSHIHATSFGQDVLNRAYDSRVRIDQPSGPS